MAGKPKKAKTKRKPAAAAAAKKKPRKRVPDTALTGAMGAPTLCSPEMTEKICSAIRAGNYIDVAASWAGLNRASLHNWLKRGRREMQKCAAQNMPIEPSEQVYVDFVGAMEKAMAASEVQGVATITRAAQDNWTAAAWKLERMFPQRWGRRDAMRLTTDEHPSADKFDVAKLSGPELRKLIDDLRAEDDDDDTPPPPKEAGPDA